VNQAASDGGGGTSPVVISHDEMRRVTSKLADAGTTSMPPTGGTGDAEMLIAAILAEFSDGAVDLISEGELLSQTADACNVAYVDADSAAAGRFLVEGVKDE
jgi:hypothetical protein